MARPTERKRHRLSQAVIDLRVTLGDTQQAFASRLGTAIATIARYETSRPPTGTALASLAVVAQEAGRGDLVLEFMGELGKELRLRDIKGGHFTVDASGDNPRGYLLLNIEGKGARAYASAFYETFQRFTMGSAEQKRKAELLLSEFHKTATQTWRKQK
jgi:transcriptional regulator with XRE-family HTH domain